MLNKTRSFTNRLGPERVWGSGVVGSNPAIPTNVYLW
jgi:hypothetical protein